MAYYEIPALSILCKQLAHIMSLNVDIVEDVFTCSKCEIFPQNYQHRHIFDMFHDGERSKASKD